MDNVPLFSSDQVLLGNGQGLSISSIGSSTFSSTYKPYTSLMQETFEFHPTFYLVIPQANFEVLLCGMLGKDGLYIFSNIFSTKSSTGTSFSAPLL
ncbi:hypothetical protein CR513_18295, partial [Mucuna pruriens]